MSNSPGTSIDRFSSLPDRVAHNILSYVSMEDILRLCLVSRRFRQLCISVPCLNFDVIPYRDKKIKRARLMNYLDRLLFLCKGMNIRRFYIRWSQRDSLVLADEEYHILSSLHNAVICNFELLNIDIKPYWSHLSRVVHFGKESTDFSLPPSLVCCRSLRILRVNLHSGTLNFPSPHYHFQIPFSSVLVAAIYLNQLTASFSSIYAFKT
ncbi:hypothetical protein L484_028039 [Morus notabilis]|uniref:F-box domain-containing protein n=1 Tax=Morus notabilis TaxID=981085 RepID=W9S7T0_9ROSA|nr:hypothetical protein L484_028039 [Morus notabilis]